MVHDVIAAIKIEPSLISNSALGTLEIEKLSFLVISLKLSLKFFLIRQIYFDFIVPQ